MATFDQLPAEQRAIIELVVARGRSYDALADVLQVSTERVRELAREALVELSPVSARRVDGQWRSKVADYLLGQQAGREAAATRDHLASSEAARTWALSLLDALDMLFGDEVPEIPEAGTAAAAEPEVAPTVADAAAAAEVGGGPAGDAAPGPEVEPEAAEAPKPDRDEERSRDREPGRDEDLDGEEEPDREAERERARAERRDRERAEAQERQTAEDRARERRREREREEPRDRERARDRERDRDGERERDDARDGERDRDRDKARERDRDRERERDRDRLRDRDDRDGAAADGAALSPAARAAVRRRRILGGVGALVLLAAIVVGILALTGAFSSDDSGSSTASSSTTPTTSTTPPTSTTSTTPSTTTPQERPQVLGQVALAPQNGVKAQGVAYILQQGSQRVLAVTAKLPPLPATQRKAAYNVWLYNSTKDAESIGAQFTTPQGDYQGVGALPANYKRFKYIDVSAQPFNRKTGHSGNSFLRGALANLKPVPKNQQPNGTTAPTGP